MNWTIIWHIFDRLKKAKEDLEQFLLENERMLSTTKYYKCEELFGNLEVWRAVGDSDRRDIYEDVIFNLAKREKEDAKQLKKRNTKKLAQALDTMTEVTYKTTWQEAQALLLQHPAFADDANLLQMDKEDALMVFENHIRQLEKDEEEEKECEKKRRKRQERKNRDGFIVSVTDCFQIPLLLLCHIIFQYLCYLYITLSTARRSSLFVSQWAWKKVNEFKKYLIVF